MARILFTWELGGGMGHSLCYRPLLNALIAAGHEVWFAMRSLQGEFSDVITSLCEDLTDLRIYVEAAIDFPEEEVDFLADDKIHRRLDQLIQELENIQRVAQQGVLLKEGMQVVLVGRPNVGKSSLLNALAGRETAIVTDVPGTTRDIVREEIHIDGMPLHIIDTAGLRESKDRVEQEGIRRTRQMMQQADLALVISEQPQPGKINSEVRADLPETLAVTHIRNKIDLTDAAAELIEREGFTEISLSAKTGQGLDLLRDHLKNCMGYTGVREGLFMARRRHLDALNRAGQFLHSASEQLLEHRAGELLAEDLRQAQQALGEITGAVSSDDLLGRIFSSFCIGK